MKQALLMLMIVIVSTIVVAEQDLSLYKYQRDITVDCENFLGYAAFEPDTELLVHSQNLQHLYIDSEYYTTSQLSAKLTNWFIQESNTNDKTTLNTMVDNDASTVYVVTVPESQLEIVVKNPVSQQFNRIYLTVQDSAINYVNFFNDGEQLYPRVVKNNFEYTYYFDATISTDTMRMQIFFDTLLKVNEITFSNSATTNKVYFFVDDDCERTYKVYYGEFGGNSKTSVRHDAGIVLSATLSSEYTNPQYNEDFDDDGVLNEGDNCVSVANTDQKDINYNGLGDACEDFDTDGIMNAEDNCPDERNYNQLDSDADGVGDVCDSDDDRFSEQNSWIFYLVALVIVGVFGFLGYKLSQKK